MRNVYVEELNQAERRTDDAMDRVSSIKKAAGGERTLVDFAQPPFDPNKMEWVQVAVGITTGLGSRADPREKIISRQHGMSWLHQIHELRARG